MLIRLKAIKTSVSIMKKKMTLRYLKRSPRETSNLSSIQFDTR